MPADANDKPHTDNPKQKVKLTIPLWGLLVPVIGTIVLLVITLQEPDGRLHMWVLDVGQGDAIVLRTPGGHVALIDGGPGATAVLNGLDAHIPVWRHEVDLVVLTHPHEDHMMGLVDVLARYRVDQVVQTEFTGTTGVRGAWLRALGERGVAVHYAQRGDTLAFDGEPDLSLKVLSPSTPDARLERAGGDINNTSIVLKVTYGETAILLEGDAQQGAEREMARVEGGELGARVLKVGHHGSGTSSWRGFLGEVRPEVAIISVGVGNGYGQPAKETLEALGEVGARVYRTDVNGTVEVIAEKGRLWVRGEK
jgi:competence protein ComEC